MNKSLRRKIRRAQIQDFILNNKFLATLKSDQTVTGCKVKIGERQALGDERLTTKTGDKENTERVDFFNREFAVVQKTTVQP